MAIKKNRKESVFSEDPGAIGDLTRRIEYLEDFRTGVLQMVRELESSEEELISAYRLLKETRDQLVQSSKLTALGELASALAHELSQPLTIIKGISQNMIGSFDEASPAHEKLTLVIHAANKMETVIKHLRIFSRKEDPAMEPLDLNRVIKEAFVMLKGLLSDNSIDVRMDLSPLPLVLGSPVRLEQVIINIVTNAKDAMPGGGVLEIKTRPEAEDGRPSAGLTIRDTGAGIPEENLSRIFDPFFTTKGPDKGTGIGLSISYGIIKEHGGEITVESVPGRGTSFHITIPAIEKPAKHIDRD
jgi:two-component system, NtrC family, sensor kinase